MNFVLGKGKWENSGDIWIRLCWVNRSLSRQQVARGHNKQKQRKCYKNLNFLFTWSFHSIFICHLTGINLGAVVTGEDARFAGSVYKEVLTWPNIRFPWGSHIEADTLPGFFFFSEYPESCTLSPPPPLPLCSKRLSSSIPLLPSFPTVHSQICTEVFVIIRQISQYALIASVPFFQWAHSCTRYVSNSAGHMGNSPSVSAEWVDKHMREEWALDREGGWLAGRLPGRGMASSLALSWKMITELEEIKEVQPGWSTEGLGNMSWWSFLLSSSILLQWWKTRLSYVFGLVVSNGRCLRFIKWLYYNDTVDYFACRKKKVYLIILKL